MKPLSENEKKEFLNYFKNYNTYINEENIVEEGFKLNFDKNENNNNSTKQSHKLKKEKCIT